MKTALFDFELPEERIATEPVSPRDAARLLVIRETGFSDRTVRDLPDLFEPGDLMVFNDTKVIPAQLYGSRGEARIAITLHKYNMSNEWQAFAKPAKRLKIGDRIIFADDFSAHIIHKQPDGTVVLQLESDNWQESLKKHGKMPLPAYMRRQAQPSDNQTYQTVYAQKEGAVAAPTAGLHFTPELLAALDAKGIKRAFVTLHVGAGTFMPVKSDDIKDHKIHSEYLEISNNLCDIINQTHKNNKRVIAVGTTSLRAIESAADEHGTVKPFEGDTNIFITPGYRFKVTDILMTNFHLPRSTLFMLTSAFMGLEHMQKAYAHAIEQKYRFYSYGDACVLIK